MTLTARTTRELRRRLADRLRDLGAVRSDAWYAAFADVPREVFVPAFSVRTAEGVREYDTAEPGYAEAVYADESLVTRFDEHGTAVSSSSQPSVMAVMLEALHVPEGGRVLEVGTGTGYNAALLSHRFGSGRVVSVDIDASLTETARARLQLAGYAPALVTGDGTAGCAEHAPFGAVLATCGVERVPVAWLEQTRPGGTVVVNIGSVIVRLTVGGDHGASGPFLPRDASFMTARPGPEHTSPRAPAYSGLVVNGTGRRRAEPLPGGGEGFLADLVRGACLEVSLYQPDVLGMTLAPAREPKIYGLVHPATGSWARITLEDAATVSVAWDGPRDLWAERAPVLTRWISAGRPGPGAYGLTVGPGGEHELWLDAAHGGQRLPLP
ncbi:methyltransferase domain-containing protein [Streptomyces sp. B1866]|uniref:methyltransferase domain-containing protein n=1 Tax=Streptomyces sp. B1866 TaxID=3075431 RepID=UPI00288ECF4E|nr:methyltransferase domain-containing protein [Streptomyces sp. B1866]MDT3398130.1 methyltransferase domain-containing protein [Streptomyces sp. B1866]